MVTYSYLNSNRWIRISLISFRINRKFDEWFWNLKKYMYKISWNLKKNRWTDISLWLLPVIIIFGGFIWAEIANNKYDFAHFKTILLVVQVDFLLRIQFWTNICCFNFFVTFQRDSSVASVFCRHKRIQLFLLSFNNFLQL